MIPLRYEGETAVFSNLQIDDYGMPEYYGFDNYIVIESREAILVTDYKMEQSYDLVLTHRYSRLARFKSTLLKLVGEKSNIPAHVIAACKIYLKPNSTDLWNDTRKILKCYKWSAYYDYIPSILYSLGLCPLLKISAKKIEEIVNDYRLLDEKFETTKHIHKRRYFPNIRYIVLKLLEHHGCLHNFPIPFVRTERILVSLSLLWQQLIN